MRTHFIFVLAIYCIRLHAFFADYMYTRLCSDLCTLHQPTPHVICSPQKGNKRETRLLGVLAFVHTCETYITIGYAMNLFVKGVGSTELSHPPLVSVCPFCRHREWQCVACSSGAVWGQSASPFFLYIFLLYFSPLPSITVRRALFGCRVGTETSRSPSPHFLTLPLLPPPLPPPLPRPSSTVWRALFGRAADSLEKGTSSDDEYMISDRDILVNKFVSGASTLF